MGTGQHKPYSGRFTGLRVRYAYERSAKFLDYYRYPGTATIVEFDGPMDEMQARKHYFQRPFQASIVELEPTGYSGQRAIKLDFLGYPDDGNSTQVPGQSSFNGSAAIVINLTVLHHLSYLSVNRSAPDLLRFTMSYREVTLETGWTDLVVNNFTWLFETSNRQERFILPSLLQPVSLRLNLISGSLLPSQVTTLGRPLSNCPLGFVPHFDVCFRLVTVQARWAEALAHCQSTYTWAGGRGTLFQPKDPMKLSFLAKYYSWRLHVGIRRDPASGGWQWLDGDPVPSSAWVLDQPGDLFGAWDAAAAGLTALASDSVPLYFACQVPLYTAPGDPSSCASGPLMYYGEPYAACTGCNDDFEVFTESLDNRWAALWPLTFMDSYYGNMSMWYRTRSTQQKILANVQLSTSWAASTSTVTHYFTCVRPDCMQPLLPGVPGQLTASISTNRRASYYRPEDSIVGSSVRVRTPCAMQRAESADFVHSLNVTEAGVACLPWTSAQVSGARDYKSYCLSRTNYDRSPECYITASATDFCVQRDCFLSYAPQRLSLNSANAAAYKTITFNGKSVDSATIDSNGFLTISTQPLSTSVTAHRLYYLLIDLKIEHTIVGLDITLANLQYGLKAKYATEWNASAGEEAFNDWALCDSLEVPLASLRQVSLSCPPGGVTGRYLAVLKPAELGFMRLESLMVYAEEVNDLDDMVPKRVEWMPDNVIRAAMANNSVEFLCRFRQRKLKVWLTDQFGYLEAMTNKRYVIILEGVSSDTVQFVGARIEHRDYSVPESFYTLANISASLVANATGVATDDFQPVQVTWQLSASGIQLAVRVANQLVGVCQDSNFSLAAIRKLGYSSDAPPDGATNLQVAFPQVRSYKTMGCHREPYYSATERVYLQVSFSRPATLMWITVQGGNARNVISGATYMTYVYSYVLYFSETGNYWRPFQERLEIMANRHQRAVASLRFQPNQLAEHVRLYRVTGQSVGELRLQLYGCPADASEARLRSYLQSRFKRVHVDSGSTAGRGNDGSLSGFFGNGGAYQSDIEQYSTDYLYWMVDLGQFTYITFIRVVDAIENLDAYGGDVCSTSTSVYSYYGMQNVTANGIPCQNWSSNSPQTVSARCQVDTYFPGTNRSASVNYCRDCNGNGYKGCYTTDPAVPYASCNIFACSRDNMKFDYEELDYAEIILANASSPTDSSVEVLAKRGQGYIKEHFWSVETFRIARFAGVRKSTFYRRRLSFAEFEVYGYPRVSDPQLLSNPVGLEDGAVQVNQLDLSDSLGPSTMLPTEHAATCMLRLNAKQLPGLPPAMYFYKVGITLDINLPVRHRISGLVTQGGGLFDSTNKWMAYVTEFQLLYGDDPRVLRPYNSFSTGSSVESIHNFAGQQNDEIALRFDLPVPILAKLVRFVPTKFVNSLALRLEILGYPEDCPVVPSDHLTSQSASGQTVSLQLKMYFWLTGFQLPASGGDTAAAVLLQYRNLRNGSLTNLTVNGVPYVFKLIYGLNQSFPRSVLTNELHLIFLNSSTPASTGVSIRGCLQYEDCPFGFFRHKSSCFWAPMPLNSTKQYPHTVAPPLVAKSICESISWNGSGHLASPRSIAEQQLFYYLFYHAADGSQSQHKFVHIDGRWNRTSGRWEWWDGSPVTWSFWQHSYPGKQCLMMSLANGGAWNNIQCDTYLAAYPFLCEVAALSTGYSQVASPISIVGAPVNTSQIRSTSGPIGAANDGDFTQDWALRPGLSLEYAYGPSNYDWWRVQLPANPGRVAFVWHYLRSDANENFKDYECWLSDTAADNPFLLAMPNSFFCQASLGTYSPGGVIEYTCDWFGRFLTVRRRRISCCFGASEILVYRVQYAESPRPPQKLSVKRSNIYPSLNYLNSESAVSLIRLLRFCDQQLPAACASVAVASLKATRFSDANATDFETAMLNFDSNTDCLLQRMPYNPQNDWPLISGVDGLTSASLTSKSESLLYTARSASYRVQSFSPDGLNPDPRAAQVAMWPLDNGTAGANATGPHGLLYHGLVSPNASWVFGPTYKTGGGLYLSEVSNSSLLAPGGVALNLDSPVYTLCIYFYVNATYNFASPLLQSTNGSLQFRMTSLVGFELRVRRRSGQFATLTGSFVFDLLWRFVCITVDTAAGRLQILDRIRIEFSASVANSSADPMETIHGQQLLFGNGSSFHLFCVQLYKMAFTTPLAHWAYRECAPYTKYCQPVPSRCPGYVERLHHVAIFYSYDGYTLSAWSGEENYWSRFVSGTFNLVVLRNTAREYASDIRVINRGFYYESVNADTMLWRCCSPDSPDGFASGQHCAVNTNELPSFAGKFCTQSGGRDACFPWDRRIGLDAPDSFVEGSAYDAGNNCRQKCANTATSALYTCSILFCDSADPRPNIGYWRAGSTDPDEWLQAAFSSRIEAHSVTVGSAFCYSTSITKELIKRYYLLYSDDAEFWYRYAVNKFHLNYLYGPFSAPDYCGSSSEVLRPPIQAMYIRLYASRIYGTMAGKLELFGGAASMPPEPRLPEIQYEAFQLSARKVTNQFDTSRPISSALIRWGSPITYGGSTYQPAYRTSLNDDVMLQLPVPHRVMSVVTAGGGGHAVSQFELLYSETADSDALQLANSSHTGNSSFLGNTEDKQLIRNDLGGPVDAALLAVRPKQALGANSLLRFGLLGYPLECPAVPFANISTNGSSLDRPLTLTIPEIRWPLYLNFTSLHHFTNLTYSQSGSCSAEIIALNFTDLSNASVANYTIELSSGNSSLWLNQSVTAHSAVIRFLTSPADPGCHSVQLHFYGCPAEECPVNFYYLNGRCIHHYSDFNAQLTRPLALEYCRNISWTHRAGLFVPVSFYDYAAVRLGYAHWQQSRPSSSVGAVQSFSVHLGVARNASGGSWLVEATGQPLSWQHWKAAEPAASDNCAVSTFSDESWTGLTDCGTRMVICEVPANIRSNRRCSDPYYNVYLNVRLASRNPLDEIPRAQQAWRNLPEAIKACQYAGRATCSSIETKDLDTCFSTMDTITVNYSTAADAGSFVVEQLCRDSWLNLMDEASNVSYQLSGQTSQGNVEFAKFSAVQPPGATGQFWNGQQLEITFTTKWMFFAVTLMGAGTKDAYYRQYSGMTVYYSDSAPGSTPVLGSINSAGSPSVLTVDSSILSSPLIVRLRRYIYASKLIISPDSFSTSGAMKIDLWATEFDGEKLSCENKTQLEVVSPQAGTQTIDCQGSWLLFYRHWDSEWRMNRSWPAYQNGFRFEGNGSSSNSSSFWLGHELLQLLFLVRDYRLRVDYWDRSGQFRYVECNRFRISPVYQNYRLTVGNCSSAFGSDEAALIASLNGLTFSAYDWGDQRVCAASSGSAWWFKPDIGCYSTTKLTGDSEQLEWSTELQGGRVSMRMLSTEKAEPARNFSETCQSDYNCLQMNDSVCLAQDGTYELKCDCLVGWIFSRHACKPIVDVRALNISTAAPLANWTRLSQRNFTLTIYLLVANGSANISEATGSAVNFNFTVYLWNNQSAAAPAALMPDYWLAKSTWPITGNRQTARKLGETIGLSLGASVVMESGRRCKQAKYLCIATVKSPTAKFVDQNSLNDAGCIGIASDVICQPPADTELLQFQLNQTEPYIRTTPYRVPLIALVRTVSARWPIAQVLDGDENFRFELHFSEQNCAKSWACLNASSVFSNLTEGNPAQASLGLEINSTLAVQLVAQFSLEYWRCARARFVCLYAFSGENASYQEVNLDNNIACQPVVLNCVPFVDTRASGVSLTLRNESWLARYPAHLNVRASLQHLSGLPIDQVFGPQTNYFISFFLQLNDTASSQVLPVATDCQSVDLKQPLAQSGTVSFACSIILNVTIEECRSLSSYCLTFNSSKNGSYTELDPSNNRWCDRISIPMNCIGVPIENASCRLSNNTLLSSVPLTVSLSWDAGSAVHAELTYGNADSYRWDWLTYNHTDHFGRHSG
ncbi:hypothetical protein BOX15_Mlig034171g2 [Macrostomum lignano]|uniref:C-type lectin domain-containing protein n=1 Tax=Macrostomum lignano TaxID=282301 RepID=A0A267EVT8_9PLAT|nr:hypothetical protein BOX15_Mlig034171g2 [Macrostomum lignano]